MWMIYDLPNNQPAGKLAPLCKNQWKEEEPDLQPDQRCSRLTGCVLARCTSLIFTMCEIGQIIAGRIF